MVKHLFGVAESLVSEDALNVLRQSLTEYRTAVINRLLLHSPFRYPSAPTRSDIPRFIPTSSS